MTTLISFCLALWLAHALAKAGAGILQILAGVCCGLFGVLLLLLALAMEALETLWQTAFPKNERL